MDRPNILLIMTDQHRGDCLGCDGHPVVQTPNLDGLAAEGVRFSAGYSATPSCIPARASLMTGMNAWHTGILGMGEGQAPMRADYPNTIAGCLGQAGYHTQLIGKMHFHPARALNGFDHAMLDEHDAQDTTTEYEAWFEANRPAEVAMREHGVNWNTWIGRPYHLPEYLHPTNWTARESINFLKRRDPTRPFFLCTSFIRPHSPYDPPQYYWDMYHGRDLGDPIQSDWSEHLADRYDWPRTTSYCGKQAAEDEHRARAGYYGCVTHIDFQVGWLLDYMRRYGLFENTLVFFTADHGDMLGDHNLWRKTYAYESSTRIPFLVRFPESMDAPRGAVCDRPVELRDIMPTALAAAGVEIPNTVDGQDLLQAATGGEWREYLQGEHCTCYSEDQEMQYVTDGKRKYVWFPRTNAEQFFDLEADPLEQHDLAADTARTDEVTLWRDRLIAELEPREVGLVTDGQLVQQSGPIVSPYRDTLYRG